MSEKNAIDDGRLIDAARHGDERAFETLYRRYRQYVLIVAARFGVTGPDALDILQETFFYLFRVLPGFTLRAKFSTFLYPTVKHLALKRKEKSARLLPLEARNERDEASAAGSTGPGETLPVRDMVAGLPEGHREVVLLRFVDGMSLDEIAAALTLPLGTVKSRLHNALAALRRQERG